MPQAGGLGAFLRGAFAKRAASRDAKGTGAPSRALLLIVAVVALVSVLAPATASAAPPTLTVDPVTTHGITTAHVSGEVSVPADGVETYWGFQYSEDGVVWNGSPFTGSVQPGEAVPVQQDLSGLSADTTYQVRLASFNFSEFVEEFSPEPHPTFTTDPAPVAPSASVDPATDVAYITAKIQGSVDPEGGNEENGGAYVPIHWALQLSDSGDPGTFTDVASGDLTGAEAESSDPIAVPASPAELTGLTNDHTYTYRLVVTYAGQSVESSTDTFTTLAVTKPSVTDPVITDITDNSAHFSAEVDPNGSDPAFDANWSFECTPSCGGLQGGTVSGSAATVENDAKFLKPNTTYTVRITATNAGGTEKRTEVFTTSAAAPVVTPFGAGPLTATSADLNGQVNPRGSATVYWFEWGTADCSANPCTSVPAEQDGSAGDATSPVYVTRHLAGLSPETTYHFRLMAENASGTTVGPDQTFTTPAAESACPNSGHLGTEHLPDCRAYEMASPPDKNGGDVMPATIRTRAALDGDAVNFTSLLSFADPKGAANGSEYISRRTAAPGTSGWATHSITPRHDPTPAIGQTFGLDPAYDGEMSDDLSRGIFRAFQPITDAPNVAGLINYYVRDDLTTPGAGSYRVITDPGFPLSPAFVPFRPFLAGASEDFSTVIFESPLNLTAEAGPYSPFPGPTKLYENRDGTLRLAGLVPPPGEAECDDAGPISCEAAPSSQAGRGAADFRPTPHMLSADGSRVFFQAPAGPNGNIYLRLNGTKTVQLDLSEKATPEPPQAGSDLWTASVDGSRVFFSSNEGLVDEDNDGAQDYYMYDFDAPPGQHLTLVSKDDEPAVTDDAFGVVGASDDGHVLYFVMTGQLVAGEPSLVAGGLYVWEEGVTKYIGEFANLSDVSLNRLDERWLYIENVPMARVAADGSHLSFAATNGDGFSGRWGFGGYDHGTACSGNGCRQIYVYSVASGRLRCASCNPSGDPPINRVKVNVKLDLSAGNVSSSANLNRAISADGRWVFFSSPDPLRPEDTNGKYDAYRYDTVTEQVDLLSTGTSPEDSWFMDASADGRDAFFATRERLSAWDRDDAYDLYDARAGGGLPEPAPVPAPCQGDGCRAAPPAPPSPSSAASAATGGPGNLTPRRCPRGKRRVVRNGRVRCVKKHPKTHKQAGKKRGGAK